MAWATMTMTMTMTMTIVSSQLVRQFPISNKATNFSSGFQLLHSSSCCCNSKTRLSSIWSSPSGTRLFKHVTRPISAVGSGMEASISDPKNGPLIALKNVKLVVESQDEDKIQVRVDVNGDETQGVFNKALTNLARTAPPIPGFRRQKGGKTSKVPLDFLLQILGEERVTNFVIQEIVSSTLADYAKKENLNVKDNKINTTQKAEELRKLFAPGKEFGFNAVLDLEKSEAETPT